MKFFRSGAALAVTSLAVAVSATTDDDSCTSHSLPNPIWQAYPGNVTGTINGTVALLPIPYKLARSIIPEQYAILSDAWKTLLPDLPRDMYPAIWQSVRDHDVRFGEYQLADFSRVSIEFPFIDLLSDGHTSFRWAPNMLLTASNEMAIKGARDYGTKVYPATFDPSCNGYEHQSDRQDTTYIRAQSIDSNNGKPVSQYDAVFSSNASSLGVAKPLPTAFFVNATNQPVFVDGSSCDNYIRLFNTSLSTGSNAALPVAASVSARVPELFGDEAMTWSDAVGMHIDTAFVENHMVSCESMRGYAGLGKAHKVQVLQGSSSGASWAFAMLGMDNLQQVFSDYLISPIRQAVLS